MSSILICFKSGQKLDLGKETLGINIEPDITNLHCEEIDYFNEVIKGMKILKEEGGIYPLKDGFVDMADVDYIFLNQ